MTCRSPKTATLLAVLVACSSAAAADPPPPGATACSGCHSSADAPGLVVPITGRPAGEIVTAMAEFRTGQRPATVMDRIAKGFSDDEVRTIAAWLEQVK